MSDNDDLNARLASLMEKRPAERWITYGLSPLGWWKSVLDLANWNPRAPGAPDFCWQPIDFLDPSAMLCLINEMEKRGWWCQMHSSFMVGDGCWAGFTPLGTTGWNGRPDFNECGATLPEAVRKAAIATLENTNERSPSDR